MFKGIFDFKNQNINLNFYVLLPVFGFLILGLVVLSSTSDLSNLASSFYKQVLWILIGSFLFFIVQYVRIQFLYDYSYIFYILLLLIISSTVLFAPRIAGAKSWFNFGGIFLQPSEFGKILYVLCMSRFFTDNKNNKNLSIYLFIILGLLLLPIILILKQPDLGTGMVYVSIILPMLFWSGLKVRNIFLLVAPIITIIATYDIFYFYIWMIFFLIVIIISRHEIYMIITNFIINVVCGISSSYLWYEVLKPHQRNRLSTFIDPLGDPLGTGYQLIQSIISIGSGGFWGKGWGQGTQTHLKFLPVRDTDFILSVMSEELGFVSILLIVVLLAVFIYWCTLFSFKIDNSYASIVLVGLSSILFMHTIMNLSVISGLLPVTGLPAPFISYGGSFMLTCCIIIGLINNIINNYL